MPDDQLSLAIGRRGQNVRLASQLTGSAIDIMTEADASREAPARVRRALRAVPEGARRRRDARPAARRRGLRRARGGRLCRARRAVARSRASTTSSPPSCRAAPPRRSSARRRPPARSAARMGVEDALAEMPYLTEAMLVTLGKAGIRTLDDLADLATDELVQKKRPEQRRQRETEPARGQRRRARRLRPDRRAGQRDHHGRPRPLVRGRGRKASARGRTRMRKLPNETLDARSAIRPSASAS